MATDHYTRLGIEKEKFDELDEKGKKELVEKQFRGSTGNLLSKLFDIFFPGLAEKRLVKLRDARDILKSELKADNIDEKENITIDHNNNQSQEQTKNNNIKSLSLDEQIKQKEKELKKIKGGRETQKYGMTNKIIEYLESELKGLMERVLEIKAAKINDLNLKLEGTKGRDNRNNIKSDIVQIANERSKLLKELNGLDSKQPKKEVGQQAELTNIPPKFTNISTEKNLKVLKDQFEKGLEKAGIDIKGMGHKEVLEKLKDNFLLNAQYEMIKQFEEESEQPEQEKSANQAKSSTEKNMNKKVPKIPITTSVTANLADKHDLLNTNKVDLNSKSPPPKPPRLSVLNEQIEQTEGNLEMMKRSIVEEKKPCTLTLKSEIVESLKSELKELKSTKLELMKDKTHEIIKERKGVTQGSEQWNELTKQLSEANKERSKLDKELDKLGYQPKPDINYNKLKEVVTLIKQVLKLRDVKCLL